MDTELKYAEERGFKIKQCKDVYWRWFKPAKK
jgi:hypothetical protein